MMNTVLPSLRALLTGGLLMAIAACASDARAPTVACASHARGPTVASWDSMSEKQRRDYVHSLINRGIIVVNKTTGQDLRHIFRTLAPVYYHDFSHTLNFSNYVEAPVDPRYPNAIPPGGYGGDHSIVFFKVDSAGILRHIKFYDHGGGKNFRNDIRHSP